MSDKAHSLAAELTQRRDEFTKLVSDATPAQLERICPGDGWPVLLTAHHVAVAFRINASWLRRVARGEAVTATRDQIDAGNAQMVADQAPLDRPAVLAELQENSAKLIAVMQDFSDEQLATSAPFGPADRDLTVKQVIRHVVLHHIEEHLADMRAALA